MVRQGFLNLSVEEQQRIMSAALDEFAEKDYESASLNRIILKANISKGSMYHYFHNKEDLFLYLLEQVMEEKKTFLQAALQRLDQPVSALDIFETLSLQLDVAVRFARENPRYHMLNTHLQNMRESPLKDRIWGRFNEEFDRYIEAMVDHALSAGEIRAGLEKTFVMRILRFVLLSFTDIYPDYRELLQKKDDEIFSEMKQLVDFIKHGLQGPERKEEVT